MNIKNERIHTMPENPMQLVYRVYRYVLPEVKAQLTIWRNKAEQIPDHELRKQAIASINTKQFHCQGGAVYAVGNLPMRHVLIPLIVAFQTISDYLDNLCDRSTSLDPNDFRKLHQSMLDAVNPEKPIHDYYAYRIENNDGEYLQSLVRTCQSCIELLPAYGAVYEDVRKLVTLYADLQVYKHIHPELREQELFNWWKKYEFQHLDLRWNEFAAATGSTLAVFMFFLAAANKQLDDRQVGIIREAYFPYICGLHILLDYLIDQEEDSEGGDLNFCSYYDNMDFAVHRIARIVELAREKAALLNAAKFHRMVIEGLLAVYLSDPKVSKQPEVKQVSRQLMKNSPMTRLFFFLNTRWIRSLT